MLLQLTTPYIRSNTVRNLQGALAKSEYGHFYTYGIDSTYGPLTAQAVYRAKYWLGYPVSKCDHIAGDYLYDFLTGKNKLPLTYRVRRNRRLRAAQATPLRLKAFGLAQKEVGVAESPAHSNRQPFGQWYGFNGVPWCAIFVTYCYVVGGKSKAFNPKQAHYSYVPNIVYDARLGRNNLTITKNPQRGDLVIYDWNGDGEADHMGLFSQWTGTNHLNFEAIEGNTSTSNDSNGGIVMVRDRLIHNVVMFVHVGA